VWLRCVNNGILLFGIAVVGKVGNVSKGAFERASTRQAKLPQGEHGSDRVSQGKQGRKAVKAQASTEVARKVVKGRGAKNLCIEKVSKDEFEQRNEGWRCRDAAGCQVRRGTAG